MVEEYIVMALSVVIMLIGVWVSSDILFEEKSKKGIKGIVWLILSSMMISIFNMDKSAGITDVTKIIIVFIITTLQNKDRYKRRISDSIIGSAIVYANILMSEVVVQIILSLLNQIIEIDLINLKYTIIASLMTDIITLMIIILLKRKYLKVYQRIQNIDTKLITTILTIFLVIIIVSGIIPLKRLELGIDMLIVIILIVGFFTIGLYIIMERVEMDRIVEKYKQLSDYAKVNEGLLEDYRVTSHENRNHLIVIDNMVPKSNKKVHEYIKSILDNGEMNKYYFINELKNIPITELKGFINYKLMEMLNEEINLQINISEQIKKSKLRRLTLKEKDDLYNVVGILLDNAYEATRESKEKELVLEMHKEKSTVVIMIANTYQGEIEIEKISEYGYSSKGRNHGTGLYIVEKIITKNQRFQKETSIMENYFIQSIRIK